MKKRIVLTAVIAAAVIFGAGAGVIWAAGTLGTRDDPLVTLSYLNERFKTELIREFDEKIAKRSEELTAKVDAYLASAPSPGGDAASAPANVFSSVTLAKDGVIKFGAGAEVLPREGTAIFIGSRLPDATTGESLAGDAAMPQNHLYIIAEAGDGVKAGSDTLKLLVRGEYELVG
ncbi:MAG: hypothetical protein LBK23_10285 [Oscillospiraceae bacterium]|jgi:hypothetical protein|nr:hypothetical protein [Oscillospiraceae bacterium]